VGFDDREGVLPVEELRQRDHRQARCKRRRARRWLTFLEKGKLPAQEQVLGNQGCARSKKKSEEGQQLAFYRNAPERGARN
jgi:hypothetical protein